MADIIQNAVTLQTTGGPNIYFIFVSDDGMYWNGSFEAYNASHWGAYAISMTEISPNIWQGTFPNVAAGVYYIYAYEYTTSPSSSDNLVGFATSTWNGVTEISSVVDDTVSEFEVGIDGALSFITLGIVDNNGGEIRPGIE